MSLDPRETLRLDEVAADRLEGVVAAPRYRPTAAHQAASPLAAIRRAPSPEAEQLDQLLFGEGFEVLETREGFAFGQARRDGYVGWVEAGALRPGGEAPTHRVVALRTTAFAAPDLKSPLRAMLSMGALVREAGREGRFVHAQGLGWLPEGHLAAIGAAFEPDPAAVAERFLGAPYLWGGRSSLGLDCSGLVQQALHACGRACPRDSDQQQALGLPLEGTDERARNDLVFWRGHVGVMLDARRLLHANAWRMAVTIEPLDEASARIEAAGGDAPLAFRRL